MHLREQKRPGVNLLGGLNVMLQTSHGRSGVTGCLAAFLASDAVVLHGSEQKMRPTLSPPKYLGSLTPQALQPLPSFPSVAFMALRWHACPQ